MMIQRNSMSHFLRPLIELIPDRKQTFQSLWGSREVSRDNDQIELTSLGSEAYQNSPGAEEGKRKRRATSESGFGEGHGKKRFRHSKTLQEIKNSVIAKQAKFRLCTTAASAKPRVT
jgi:hypothetical protein